MEIVIYRRQRVDYGEQSDTTCLVPKFAFCVAGPSEFFIQRFSIERSRTASPVTVLQRATGDHDDEHKFCTYTCHVHTGVWETFWILTIKLHGHSVTK